MTLNMGSVGDKGENRAITQFAESEIFRADFFLKQESMQDGILLYNY